MPDPIYTDPIYTLAHMWLNLAAAQGFEKAAELHDLLEENMTPVQLAEAQRLAREWKATPAR